MSDVHTVAVFCGAHAGHDPVFRAAATGLGRAMARAGMRLVYGGGRVGLMGALADGLLTRSADTTRLVDRLLAAGRFLRVGLTPNFWAAASNSARLAAILK